MINERIIIEEKTKDYDEAWIETYFWQESVELYPGQKRPAIVICPGGAYAMTSDREAEAVALRFMSMGYHAVVLRYSVAPARYPAALRQLAKTVALLRENSEKWHIETDKIIVSGFSAGGHLAASLGVFWNTPELKEITGFDNEMIRPDGMILNYPVITSGEFGHQESFHNLLGEKYEELNRLIQEQLDRGTTLVYTQTGYLKNDQPMILTVVSNRELMRLNQLVQETDPHAFMIIGNVNEVRGRGFSQQKVYKKEQEER